jgi:class 3 adenylate cyclase
MPPEEVVAFLNEYFEEMVTAIHDAGGTLDKFIGDGIMAFFGAPNRLENPCDAALGAAQEMLVRMERYNDARLARGQDEVRMGIGLHYGEVVVGQVGSRTRREFTAVGDVVNTASRLEGLTKDQGLPVVVSDAVHRQLSEAARARVPFEPLGALPIRGRASLELWGWGRAHGATPAAAGAAT